MTVASEAFFTDWFLADGVTKDWSYDFGIISSTHVRVLVRDGTDDTTVVEYNSGFSFFPAADYGSGVVRYPATGSALAVGKQVRILRQMDFLQSTEIGMEGSFAPILHERAFDKLTMQTQQLKEDAKRSMKAPLGSTGYEFSSGFLDYQTFMKLGNLIVPGPTAEQIENAKTNAEEAIAARMAAEAARDLAAGYAASIIPGGFYTKGQIDGFRTTDQNAAKDASNLTTGTVPDARLSERLQPQAKYTTDWNTVLESGWYRAVDEAHAPTNGYIHCYFGYTIFHGDGYAYQEVTGYGAAPTHSYKRTIQNGDFPTWQRIYQTAEEIQTLMGFVTPERFGAVGDGVADDSDALAAALLNGAPVQLVGQYRITRTVEFGPAYNGGKSTYIQGSGKQHIVLDGQWARLFWAGGAPTNFQSPMLIARDFVMVCPRTDHQTAGLELANTGGSGSTTKTFEVRNVHTVGVSDTTGTLWGIAFFNQRNGVVDGCVHQGKRSLPAGSRVGYGIIAGGDGDPVDFTIVNCHAYFCQYAIYLSGTHEGITIDKCVAAAVDRGVDAEFDENPISGDNQGKPLLKVTNCHFNAYSYGIFMDRVRDYTITGNDFLAEAANSNWVGIYSDVDGGASVYGWIDGNKFQDAWGVSSGNTIGIDVDAHTTGVTDSRIGVNRFVSLKTGINIQSNVKNLRWSAASLFAGVTTSVNNFGGGTNTSY